MKHSILLAALLALSLSACGKKEDASNPPVIPSATPEAMAPVAPAPEVAPVPAPTPEAAAGAADAAAGAADAAKGAADAAAGAADAAKK